MVIWFISCYICFIKQGDFKFSSYITSLLPKNYQTDLRPLDENPETTIYSLHFTDGNVFNIQAQVKDPGLAGKIPAILLLGGMMTGKKAVEYAYNVDSVLLIAPDYPYTVKSHYSFWDIMKDLSGAHQALHMQIRDNLVLLDYLRHWDRIDTSRISVIGYSFGVPFACATAALDQKLNGLALIYGGAGLKQLLRINFKLYRPFLNRILIELFWFFISDFEPAVRVHQLKPLPLLCINGEFDAKIPKELARALHDQIPFPKTVIWLASDHVHPNNKTLNLDIIQHLKEWYHLHRLD